MGVIKSVSSGEPIKAGWANSLVHEVNTKQGLRLIGKTAHSTSLRPVRIDNDPAWQIRYSSGRASINAGQVYINGMLIDGGVTSFNQVCSAKNWKETSSHVPQSADDFPIWFLTISCPKLVTKENLKEVECSLVLGKSGEEPKAPSPNEGEEEKEFIVIQMNDVKDGTMVQRVSGSIYIDQATVSMVSGDGIQIEQSTNGQTDVIKVSLYVSFIGEDGIEVIESYGEEESQPEGQAEGETEQPQGGRLKVIRIKGTSTPLSFIGKDGITVTDELVHEDISTEEDETNIWKETRVITIGGEAMALSFIGEDGITVTESIHEETTGEGETAITKKTKVITITGENQEFSFIGKDAIQVSQSEEEVTKDDGTVSKVQVVTIEGKIGISVVGEDGITVKESTVNDVTTFTVSGKAGGISIIGQDPIQVNESTSGDVTTFTISTTSDNDTISLIAGDGISITSGEEDGIKTFTISSTASSIEYDFDSNWFTVTNNSVTLKESAIDAIVTEAVNELSVQVEGSGLIESTFRGSLTASTEGSLSLNTFVSY